jgi:hypothetical protein
MSRPKIPSRKASSGKTRTAKNERPFEPPVPPVIEDDQEEDGDIATPKRDRDDEQQGL